MQFFPDKFKYLGHRIDANGLHPTTDKVKAVVKAPRPKTVTELKSYLGLLLLWPFSIQPFNHPTATQQTAMQRKEVDLVSRV